MITSIECINKFGNPLDNQKQFEKNWMIMYDITDTVNKANPIIPNRIYVHKQFGKIINEWFLHLMNQNLLNEIKTWDGCFNIRLKRGLHSLSIHSFACAIDLNASHNPLGLTREQCLKKNLIPFSEKFITESRKFVDCGADWKNRPDGMHFQIKSI